MRVLGGVRRYAIFDDLLLWGMGQSLFMFAAVARTATVALTVGVNARVVRDTTTGP
jgi:hypothetical protein